LRKRGKVKGNFKRLAWGERSERLRLSLRNRKRKCKGDSQEERIWKQSVEKEARKKKK